MLEPQPVAATEMRHERVPPAMQDVHQHRVYGTAILIPTAPPDFRDCDVREDPPDSKSSAGSDYHHLSGFSRR
jgi:hypothetical protein